MPSGGFIHRVTRRFTTNASGTAEILLPRLNGVCLGSMCTLASGAGYGFTVDDDVTGADLFQGQGSAIAADTFIAGATLKNVPMTGTPNIVIESSDGNICSGIISFWLRHMSGNPHEDDDQTYVEP